jgi:CheY-like chemotaxis protein
VERPSEQRRQHERRRLWDRRAPESRRRNDERRTRDRRGGVQQSSSERRAGNDRRHDDRREQDRRATPIRRRGRRRRATPTPFSSEQFAELRNRFAAPGQVECPACGGRFSLGPGRRRGSEVARRVVCLGCGRAAVVPNTHVSRILLVSLHAARRDALQAILANAGHEVVETDDTGVALYAYQSAPADIIFLDVQAPGRIGAPDFLRRLRRMAPDARVIAMAARPSYTGAHDPLAITQGLGAVRILRVPSSPADVLRIVDEVRP